MERDRTDFKDLCVCLLLEAEHRVLLETSVRAVDGNKAVSDG